MSFGFGFGFPKNYVAALFNTPASLFTTGVNGAWYDPSDFSTMFQDAAGTTPVTAVGQPVGRILDKSGRGNHAFNPSGNSANFPVLSARYNLLTKTEDFSDAYWINATTAVTRTAGFVAPDGTSTAWRLVFNTTNQEINSGYTSLPSNQLHSVWIKGTAGETITLGASSTVITLTGDWQYVSAVSALTYFWIGTWNGSTARTVYVWHPAVRVANDALNQPAYQRVNTATDYDTVGFKPYLSFNGVNQWLQTNSIDFTYGDKMFVSAGVRKLSDAAIGMLIETSAVANSNDGAFAVAAPGWSPVAGQYGSLIRASVDLVYANSPASFAAPITSVLSESVDFAGSTNAQKMRLRVNGADQSLSFFNATSTGNFGNYPLYIGARAGASLWFNGRLYGMVVAGKQASASEIASTEAWLNQKTGAY